jgi:hypothetical protein
LNLGLAAVLLLIATGPFGLDARAIGLKGGIAGGAAAGAAIGAALTLPLFVGAAAPATAARLADRRVAGLCGRRLAYQVLVRIPLGTALVEEVAFRGVLLAAWRPWGAAAGRRVSPALPSGSGTWRQPSSWCGPTGRRPAGARSRWSRRLPW